MGKMSFLREAIQTLLLALLIYLIAQANVQVFAVQRQSMEPNIHEGQRLLVNKTVYRRLDGGLARWLPFHKEGKWAYPFHPPRRGEVVVLRAPGRRGEIWIKRIIGLPGDKVEMLGDRVYINGQPLTEPYVRGTSRNLTYPVVVPKDSYFVMGDNRSYSIDSSDWEGVGPIPYKNIIGKAWISIWPPGRAPNYALAAP